MALHSASGVRSPTFPSANSALEERLPLSTYFLTCKQANGSFSIRPLAVPAASQLCSVQGWAVKIFVLLELGVDQALKSHGLTAGFLAANSSLEETLASKHWPWLPL